MRGFLFSLSLFSLSLLAAAAQAQPLTHGVKPAGFDGTQVPTERPAQLVTPLEVRYPESAWREHRHGVAIIAAWIDEKGYVTYAEVPGASGHADLDAEALRAVVDGDFKPALRDGKPCASRISAPVEFRIRRDEEEYDATKTEEQLEQEAEELRRAREMLEKEQRELEEELQRLKAEQRTKKAQK